MYFVQYSMYLVCDKKQFAINKEVNLQAYEHGKKN